jgi:hypothetical protein
VPLVGSSGACRRQPVSQGAVVAASTAGTGCSFALRCVRRHPKSPEPPTSGSPSDPSRG